MADTTDKNRVLCDNCWGSGDADGQPCDVCNGEGWVLSTAPKVTPGESGFNVLDDVGFGVGSTRTMRTENDTAFSPRKTESDDDSIFGGQPRKSNSLSVLGDTDIHDASGNAPLDREAELEKLHQELEIIRHRIEVLESDAPGGNGTPGRHTPPATMEDFLQLLDTTETLNPKQLRAARNLANDVKAFARKLIAAKLLTEWQAAQLVAGRSPFLLDKYKLLRLLGRGDMGDVFLCDHVTLNRRVAVRVLSRQISRNKAVLERFLAEARTLAELNHPNIIQAYSVDGKDQHYYLIMEYVDGANFKQIVGKRGPLEPCTAADFIRQAAEGLRHAHVNGFIHGNIKPSNFLVDRENTVKILDLGLGGLQQHNSLSSNGSQSANLLNSIDYLAPEHALGSTDIDHRADLYSLGCTFYFLLTGGPPFPEGPLYEKLAMHQSAQPKSIKNLRKDVADPLVEMCDKLMAKKPNDRYQSADAVAEALRDFLTGTKKGGRTI